jgi:broad specificity phosphatase PhoE
MVFLMMTNYSDEPVSATGVTQIHQVAQKISTSNFGYGCPVYHSPLQRARDTAHGLFPSSEFIELDFLREETPTELITFGNGVKRRIDQLHDWLANHEADTIYLVGHSRYFRRMTGMDRIIDNCSVLHCTFDSSNESNKWAVHEIVYCLDDSPDSEYLRGKAELESDKPTLNTDDPLHKTDDSREAKEI